MSIIRPGLACFILFFSLLAHGRERPLYSWWNVLHYNIAITPDYNKKSISGTNSVKFTATRPGNLMQVDLTGPMRITRVTWIHEGFTKYLETLYTAYLFGNEAGDEYALGTWKRIKNDKPVLGTNTSDKYYKGSAMLHAIRQITCDSVFRGLLRGMNEKFYHQTIDTKQVLDFLNGYYRCIDVGTSDNRLRF